MILSPNRRLAFVHIPHTGGTSLETLWAESLSLPTDWVADDGRAKHATALEIRGLLVPPDDAADWVLFTIHRNAWARIHSEFHHLRADYAKWKAGQILPHGEWADRMGNAALLSFPAWLTAEWGNRHLSPWEHYATDWFAKPIVSRVLRFDQLGQDWAALCHDRGMDSRPLPVINRVEHPPYQTEFDAASREIVANVCRAEIERFGDVFGGPG